MRDLIAVVPGILSSCQPSAELIVRAETGAGLIDGIAGIRHSG